MYADGAWPGCAALRARCARRRAAWAPGPDSVRGPARPIPTAHKTPTCTRTCTRVRIRRPPRWQARHRRPWSAWDTWKPSHSPALDTDPFTQPLLSSKGCNSLLYVRCELTRVKRGAAWVCQILCASRLTLERGQELTLAIARLGPPTSAPSALVKLPACHRRGQRFMGAFTRLEI